MSDLFHEDVPDSYIIAIFNTMSLARWHKFQILTKRSDRLLHIANSLQWPENIWMGVSVENDAFVHRISDLIKVPAAVRFLSLEPLIGSIPHLKLDGIDWVIVGGESGPKARPMHPEWVIEIMKKCKELHVPFFFKQWGGANKKAAGRLLNGRIWEGLPSPKKRYKPAA